MRSKLDPRPTLNERLALALTADQKREVYAVAISRGIGVSEFVREAITAAVADYSAPPADRRAAA
jgi:hypothetical protein